VKLLLVHDLIVSVPTAIRCANLELCPWLFWNW
jgi:hypothetical protein